MGTSAVDEPLADVGVTAQAMPEVIGDASPTALASPLAVSDCAVAAVAACLAAAADLAWARTGRLPAIAVDPAHVAAAVRSEAWLRDPAGQALSGFAPLSRLWPAADGWIRTHANYPWHRAALLGALRIPDGADTDIAKRLAEVIAERAAGDVEDCVYQAGGLAVAARTTGAWQASEPGRAVAADRLVTIEPFGPADPMPAPGSLPASGLRVLDLTRVIAGPVGTRMLGALGADVLRVDDPHRPELALHAVDGVIGKASTALDATTRRGRDILHGLVDQADVLVTGYRPGALRALDLDAEQVAQRHPGTIVVTLSAWGATGPWGDRRGFDSLVQIATGIGWATSTDGTRPGVLPCQLLDHATGYLVAAGTFAALTRRARNSEATHVQLSLARTAQWLIAQGTRNDNRNPTSTEADVAAYRVSLGDGWTSIGPPGQIDGKYLDWPHLPPRYAQASPAWT